MLTCMKTLNKSQSLTLIEVIVAMTLMGIILTFLWQSYFNSQRSFIKMQEQKKIALSHLYFQEKMSLVMAQLQSDGSSSIYTTKDSDVFFKISGDIDADSIFSKINTCSLVFSEDHCLRFIEWGKQEKTREEILFHSIQNVQFMFYDPINRSWLDHWEKENSLDPTMIKIIIDSHTFSFFPAKHPTPIFYHQQSPL